MAHPPALCDNCGALVPATGYNLGEGAVATFEGCGFSPCPRCGGFCEVLDGSYEALSAGAVKILAAPGATFEALRRAAQIAADSRAAGEDPERTIERVSEVLPAFAALKGHARTIASFLAFTALAYFMQKAADRYIDPFPKPPELTAVQVEKIVKDAVQQAMAGRAAAAQGAGVSDPVAPVTSPKPVHPHFPKSMEKLIRESDKRYRNQGLQGIPGSKGSKRPKSKDTKRADGDGDH